MAQWSTRFFGASGSVASYYSETSYGNLTIAPAAETSGTANDGIVGWLTLPENHPNSGTDIGSANRVLTHDAVVAADSYVNFGSYDTNGDGYLQSSELHVTVIVAGREASYSGCTGPSIWGHRWTLLSTQTPSVDGVLVGYDGSSTGYAGRAGGYTQFGELDCDHMATVGIMVHELGHDLVRTFTTRIVPRHLKAWGNGASWIGSWLAVSGQQVGYEPRTFRRIVDWAEGWLTPTHSRGQSHFSRSRRIPPFCSFATTPTE